MGFDGKKIKKLLESKGLTYKDLAKSLAIAEKTVYNYITERSKIDVYTIEKIAQILEVPVSYFFGETSDISGYIPNEEKENSKELKAKLEGCMKLIEEKDKQIRLLQEMIELLRGKAK